MTSTMAMGPNDWLVWHGRQEKYQIFDTLGGRFNSEFGMEAFPHVDTIKHYCTDSSQLYPQSHMLDFHNKADGHERRIATYLVENFRTQTDLEVSADNRVVVNNNIGIKTKDMAGIYPPDAALPGRGVDVRIPWLAKAVGPAALLRRCIGLAAKRLLACHVMVDCGLLSAEKACILRNETRLGAHCRRGEAGAP
jgi:hypothetical protein